MGDDMFERKVRELENIMNFAFESQKMSDKKKRRQNQSLNTDSEMNTSLYEDLEILLPNFKVRRQRQLNPPKVKTPMARYGLSPKLLSNATLVSEVVNHDRLNEKLLANKSWETLHSTGTAKQRTLSSAKLLWPRLSPCGVTSSDLITSAVDQSSLLADTSSRLTNTMDETSNTIGNDMYMTTRGVDALGVSAFDLAKTLMNSQSVARRRKVKDTSSRLASTRTGHRRGLAASGNRMLTGDLRPLVVKIQAPIDSSKQIVMGVPLLCYNQTREWQRTIEPDERMYKPILDSIRKKGTNFKLFYHAHITKDGQLDIHYKTPCRLQPW